MKIAIISDIHDNVWNLRAAMHWLASLQGDEAAQELICCGDLCSPFVLSLLANGFSGPIHAVAGNNEGDWRQIMINAAKANETKARQDLARMQELADKQVISRMQLDAGLVHRAHLPAPERAEEVSQLEDDVFAGRGGLRRMHRRA